METIFTPDILQMMLDIRLNNNKQFMQEHKAEYVAKMRDPYYRLIELLAPAMRDIDPKMEVRPYKALSRIFRDTRFSHNKAPYRDHHWVAFRHEGEPREGSVVFWFEIHLDSVNWGFGFWGENRKAMDMLRRRITANPDELLGLLPILTKHHFSLEGAKYRRLDLPEGLPKALEPWYKSRELYLIRRNVDPKWVFEPDFHQRLIKDFTSLAPFYRLLRGCYELAAIEE